jgi:hypothetical protein
MLLVVLPGPRVTNPTNATRRLLPLPHLGTTLVLHWVEHLGWTLKTALECAIANIPLAFALGNQTAKFVLETVGKQYM